MTNKQVGDWVILFAKVNPNARIPSKRDEDGCYDIYACIDEDVIIKPGEVKLIPTGIASAFNKKYRLDIRERGSTGTKGIARRAGQIDSGFRGEWFVAINNTSTKAIIFTNTPEKYSVAWEPVATIYDTSKKAIAQGALEIVPDVDVQEVTLDQLMEIKSERGTGQIGSSGK